MTDPAVSFRDVSIVFGRGPAMRRALQLLDEGKTREEILAATGHVVGVSRANLAIAPGEICVLMGLSGSGKSTLLRAVNRLNTPSRGEVLVRTGDRTVNVVTCDSTTLRDLRGRTIAMVFQQFALLPWRTVRDNVGLGLELRGLARAERDRIVDEKLSMVGLSRWADKYGHELSGGMQQRVGLARAFATDADILLMDEPFSALDPLIRTRLQDELLELQAKLRKTIIFVSHDLDEAIKLGNRIVIMEGGRIVQAGSSEDIILRPADSYVADFVRHMNPLEALRASAVMTPIAALPREGNDFLACPSADLRLTLDRLDRVATARAGHAGAVEPVVPMLSLNGSAEPVLTVSVPPDLPLKEIVALRHARQCPILVVDSAGVLLGAIRDSDIYRALLRAETVSDQTDRTADPIRKDPFPVQSRTGFANGELT